MVEVEHRAPLHPDVRPGRWKRTTIRRGVVGAERDRCWLERLQQTDWLDDQIAVLRLVVALSQQSLIRWVWADQQGDIPVNAIALHLLDSPGDVDARL
jgi:hypothetical protein